jgi:hypothetical protein
LNIDLNKVSSVESHGFIIAKVTIGVGDHVYKFGVLNPGSWAKTIRRQIASMNFSETS